MNPNASTAPSAPQSSGARRVVQPTDDAKRVMSAFSFVGAKAASAAKAVRGVKISNPAVQIQARVRGKLARQKSGALRAAQAAAASQAFMVAMETGFGKVDVLKFGASESARNASKRLWCSWVMFYKNESGWIELEHGGVGFGHDNIRQHVAKMAEGVEPSTEVGKELMEQANAVEDAGMADSLRSAIRSMEAAFASVGRKSGESSKLAKVPDASTPESVRAQLSAAFLRPKKEEAAAVADLGAVMNSILGSAEGADKLVDVLVSSLEPAPPTDEEMVVLRRLQDNWADKGGMEAYAVASVWLAALFVRTERCIAARSRLNDVVRAMSPEQLAELQAPAARLVATELPALLQSLEDVAMVLQKYEKDIVVQENATRGAKGLSAGLSVVGTGMAFTPLMPVGLGLLAAGAVVGIGTATGDAIGQNAQKEGVKDKLKKLSAAQEKVEHQLRALIAYSFPNVPPEEFVAASMPMRFAEPLPEDVAGKIALYAGGAAARVAAPVLMRVGFTVTSRSLLVLGAAFSTGDFVHSVLTNSPNREVLRKVHGFLEGEAETFRAWWVLLCHWASLGQQGEQSDQASSGEWRGADEAVNVNHELRSSMMSAMESKLSHLTSPVQRGSMKGIDPKPLEQDTPAVSAKAPPAPAPVEACPAPPEAAATGLGALGAVAGAETEAAEEVAAEEEAAEEPVASVDLG